LPTKRRTSSRTAPSTSAGAAPRRANLSANSSWCEPYSVFLAFIASVTPSLSTIRLSSAPSSR